jgi:hypothetical protein
MLSRVTYICTCMFVLLTFVGCSGAPRPSNSQTALQSLEKMLETWKTGGTAADLKTGQPSVIAVDDDWERKATLIAYQVQPNPFDDGVNLHYTVQLTLKNAKGKEVKKEQVYIVGTNPVITIFRKS